MFEHPQADERRALALVERFSRELQESRGFNDDGWEEQGRVGGGGDARATYSGGPLTRRRSGAYGQLRDRDEGRYMPFYEDERDLARQRQQMRNLATYTSVAVGAMQALQVYTVGGEWEFVVEAAPGQDPSDALLTEVQVVLDRIMERNDWAAGLDLEIHDKSREDGEIIVAGYLTDDGLVDLRIRDVDGLREPAAKKELNRWIGLDDRMTSWTFGCATVFNERMQCIDHENHLGYHVAFDDSGSHWAYLPNQPRAHGPEELVGVFGHQVKRNTPRPAKRGISDYYPVLVDLEREDKLHENYSVGAAVLAAIAWIEEMPPNVNRDQMTSQLSAAMDSISGAITNRRGANGRTVNRMGAGTVIKTSAGRKYTAPPMAGTNTSIFMGVGGAIKRRIGNRWQLPEFMITGDASNANYASTIVSVSPFTKAREADQKFYVRNFRQILTKCLKVAFDYGRFDGLGVRSFQELMRAITLSITAPQVATEEKAAKLAELNSLYEKRLIDGNEMRVGLGHEPDPELEGVRAPEAPEMIPGVGPGIDPAAPEPVMVEAVQRGARATALLEAVGRVRTFEEASAVITESRNAPAGS